MFGFNNSALLKAVEHVQKAVNTTKIPTDNITAALEEYQRCVAPLLEPIERMNKLAEPLLSLTKQIEMIDTNPISHVLKNNVDTMRAILELDISGMTVIASSVANTLFSYNELLKSISVDEILGHYKNDEITDEQIAEEVQEIIDNPSEKLSISEKWDAFKKTKRFIALIIIFHVLRFMGAPIIDKLEENTRELLGINQFWEESGMYKLIDELFGVEKENYALTEQEAKETVDNTQTGNISKQKREDLLDKIKKIRTYISAAPQDKNTGNLLSYLSDLEKDLNGKKYGLIFEEHREDIDEVLETHTPVLTEDPNLFLDYGGQMNFLIEGDNLAALQLLEKTHKGRIDLIYIDPPYNTGTDDFIYDDKYVEKTDLFKHSKWLAFMGKRLQIAHRLLSKTGYIFISIDDNEIAPLTLLCDEIFGEQNHINTITVNMNSLSGVKMTHAIKGKRYPTQKEYLLLYKRSSIPAKLFIGKKHKETWDKEYNLIVPELQKGQFESFDRMSDSAVNAILADMHLESLSSYTASNNINITDEWLWANAYRIFGTKSNRPLAKRAKEKLFSQQIMCYTNKDGNNRYFRSDFNREARDPRIELVQAESNSSVFLSDNWIDISNDGGVAQEGGVVFPKGKKPLSLVTRVLEAANNKNATVLDFFAGSGTTGHAVLYQNSKDSGKRKFIICTNNQNNICHNITYKRMQNIMHTDRYASSLKYYKIEYIPISERMYYEYADELLAHIRELVELENGVNFTGNAEIGIVLTEEDLNHFIANVNDFAKCHKLYMGHDLLPSDEQERVLKDRGIEISIIPDYYYKDLQED